MTDEQAAGLRGVRRCDRCNGIMIHSRLRGYYCTNGCAPLSIEEIARKEGREPKPLVVAAAMVGPVFETYKFDPVTYLDSLKSLTNDQRMAIINAIEERYCSLCGGIQKSGRCDAGCRYIGRDKLTHCQGCGCVRDANWPCECGSGG